MSKNNNITEKNKQSSNVLNVSQAYVGPIPPSSELKGYEAIVHGAAERIIRMAEKEQEHRHALQNSQIEIQKENLKFDYFIVKASNKVKYFSIGVMAFITICGIGAGTYLSLIGKTSEGIASILGGVALIISGSIMHYKREKLDINQMDKEG